MEIKRVDLTLGAAENFAAGTYVLLVAEALGSYRTAHVNLFDMPLKDSDVDLEVLRDCISALPSLTLARLIQGDPVVTTLRTYISTLRKQPKDSMRSAAKILTKQFPELTTHTVHGSVATAVIRCRHAQLQESKDMHWLKSGSGLKCKATTTFTIT